MVEQLRLVRWFTIYKIRSMYMDAERRKAELMKDNRVSDGMMFKLDWDPRIIGNRILPDGTKKTGVRKTIRWYLDNRSWWETIISGEYRNYYETMYGNR